MVKSSFINKARSPIFQAQDGCKRLLVSGHTAMAHCSLPRLSMDFAVIAVFWIKSSKTSRTRVCSPPVQLCTCHAVGTHFVDPPFSF